MLANTSSNIDFDHKVIRASLTILLRYMYFFLFFLDSPSFSLFLYRVCMWTIGIYKEALKDRRHFVFILDINLWTKNFFFYLHFLSLWIDLEKKIFFFDFYFLSRKKETKIIVFAVYLFKRFEIIETKSI